MGKKEIIERYIDVGIEHLPTDKRNVVGRKLYVFIENELVKKYGDHIPTEEEVKATLFELGSPSKLADQYREQSNDMLKLAGIVLPCVLIGLSIVWLIKLMTLPMPLTPVGWYSEIGSWVGMMLSGAFIGVGIMVILFAICQQKGIDIKMPFYQDEVHLDSQKQRGRISRGEAFFGIVGEMLFIVVFLVVPNLFCGFFESGREVVPLFNLSYIETTWYIVLILGGLGILKEVYKFVYARYNVPVMLVTVATNIGGGLLTVAWLKGGLLINPYFLRKIIELFDTPQEWMFYLLGNIQEILLVVIIFGLVIETLYTIIKTITQKI